MMGVLLTLGFVLALLGVALKLLRKFAPTSTTGARLRMEIVQRLALGPKQGIAVIRVGDRHVAVSVGEGGIHRLFELEPGEVAEARAVDSAPANAASRPDFKSALTTALRSATGLMVAAMIAFAAPRAASAQQAVAPTTTSRTAQSQSATQFVQKITAAAAQSASRSGVAGGPD